MMIRALFLLLLLSGVKAHELPDARATLVLRDETHVVLTLQLPLTQALAATLAANRPYQAFLVEYASLSPAAFATAYARALEQLQRDTRLSADADVITWQAWRWPGAEAAQALIRQQIMRTLTGGHEHEVASEIQAEALSRRKLSSLSLQLPAALQRVLLVTYQPTQRWLSAGETFSWKASTEK